MGWAGWQVYITEQSEGSVIRYYYYYVASYYDVCMRCLGDVSRGVCEVTRSFLGELSCCMNRYTSVGGIVFGG